MRLNPQRQELAAAHLKLALWCVRSFLVRVGRRASSWQLEVLNGLAVDALCLAALKFPGQGKFSTYAVTVIRRRLFRKWFKGLGDQCEVSLPDELTVSDTEDGWDKVDVLLAKLPEREGAVIRARLVELKEVKQVARELRLSTGQVTLILRRSLRRLRAILKEVP